MRPKFRKEITIIYMLTRKPFIVSKFVWELDWRFVFTRFFTSVLNIGSFGNLCFIICFRITRKPSPNVLFISDFQSQDFRKDTRNSNFANGL